MTDLKGSDSESFHLPTVVTNSLPFSSSYPAAPGPLLKTDRKYDSRAQVNESNTASSSLENWMIAKVVGGKNDVSDDLIAL